MSKRMYDLPVFPLNTVLFPGMPLKLHIFEERYKLMINRCYQSGQPFGVALIKSGQEVGGRAEPFLVGCTAIITEMEPLPGGRMNIVAVGRERFMAHSFKYDQPYLVAEVETLELSHTEADLLNSTSRSLRPWVQHYLQTLADATETKFDIQQLPDDPLQLAYLASSLLNVPIEQKQDLLNIENADEFINNLRIIYRREVTLLDAMLAPDPIEDSGVFSAN
jgi:Lon protease-like protein